MLDNARDLSNMDPILAVVRVNTLYPARSVPSRNQRHQEAQGCVTSREDALTAALDVD